MENTLTLQQEQEQRMERRKAFFKRMESRGKLGIPFVAGDTEFLYSARLQKVRGGWIDLKH